MDLLDQCFCTFNSPQVLDNFASAYYIDEAVVIPRSFVFALIHLACGFNSQPVDCTDSQNFKDSKSYWN
jgi:hypothetical protein